MNKILSKTTSSNPEWENRRILFDRLARRLAKEFRPVGRFMSPNDVVDICQSHADALKRLLRNCEKGWRCWQHYRAQTRPVSTDRMYEIFAEEAHRIPKFLC